MLNKAEAVVHQLNGYRNYGDLCYLTDVAAGRFDQVRLLQNPPAIDRIVWMWRGIAKSIWWPVKAHGMEIYCRKLGSPRFRRGGREARNGEREWADESGCNAAAGFGR